MCKLLSLSIEKLNVMLPFKVTDDMDMMKKKETVIITNNLFWIINPYMLQ